MTTIRTATRLLLASLTVGLGASFATAKDKTPAKPNAAPAAKQHAASVAKPQEAPKVQGHKVEDVKKPNSFSFGASQPAKGVKESAKIMPEAKKPNGMHYKEIELVKSPRDAASGQAMGKTKSPQASNLQGQELQAAKATSTAKLKNPGYDANAAQARNDTGTRSGTSLVLSGIIDIIKGGKEVLTGNTESGFKKIDQGAKRVQTGSNGNPADNGKPLNGGEGGEGEGGEGGGSEGGESGK